MKKQVKLKARETSATNRDFYNLFRPIAPSIDIIGKVAQVISGLTEAVTIWYITQSEMAGMSKGLSILISILAMILVISILELGGRKFLQVMTRALVWKRLKNAWYVTLFVIVTIITTGMGVLSFNLSTNGIHHTFVSNIPVAKVLDDAKIKKEYRDNIKEINTRFDNELALIKENHKETLKSTADKYDSKTKAATLKVEDYNYRYKKGESWAKSHADKHRNIASELATEKAATAAALNDVHTKKVNEWLSRKNKALDTEKTALAKNIAAAESVMGKVHQSKFKNAEFWGTLFSFFVGFSVVLAFVCIISVEVFRRGSGIQVEYQEEDKDPAILEMLWYGLMSRLDYFFRSRAERFAKVSGSTSRSSIGFNNASRSMATASNKHSLPTGSVDDYDMD